MRIALCGRLAVSWRGEAVEGALRGRQGRLLFAYLVLHRGRVVRRDELVDALWSDGAPPAGAERLLAPHLSRLRRILGTEAVDGRADLRLVLPEDTWIDWEAAHTDLAAAQAAFAAGDLDAASAAAAAVVATADAGLLPGLEAVWIEGARAELADARVEALEILARTGARQGGAALAPAQRAGTAAVDAAPFRESARVALMEVLRARGNVAEALRVYEDGRELLMDELGAVPGPQLVALHADLLRAADAPPAPSLAPSPEARPAEVLVERDAEIARLTALLPQLRAGRGHVVVIEGAAGLGKTRLLTSLRDRIDAEDGIMAVTARAGRLERDFPFGVVRQLLEPMLAGRGSRFEGAAAAAAPVFGAGGDADAGADSSFAVLHGLHWLALDLAAERPLLLAVDDLQWCDRPSLRFLAYLARRVEHAPLLLVSTLRSGEPATDALLQAEITEDPRALVVRPGPLSVAAVGVLVGARLEHDVAPEFAAACHEATGGNPLLLSQLLVGLAADAVRPDAASVGVVRDIGRRAVSRNVVLRLGRLPDDCVRVAQAISVLGESAELPVVAALAGIDEAATGEALTALMAAEIVRSEPPLGFVHPLVGDAISSEIAAGERALRHEQAAAVLRAADRPADEIAVHLLAAPRRGDAQAVAVLRDAAASAIRKGAPDSAVALLQRTLEESGAGEPRAQVLLDLGLAEAAINAPGAAQHLRGAYDELTDPVARATAAYALARTHVFLHTAPEVVPLVRESAAALGDAEEDLRLALTAIELQIGWLFGPGDTIKLLEPYRDRPPTGDGPGAKRLLAVALTVSALTGGSAATCTPLARRALAGGTLARADQGLFVTSPMLTLAMADGDEVIDAWALVEAEAHRSGSLLLATNVHIWRGWTRKLRGELIEAEHSLRTAVDNLRPWGAFAGHVEAFLAEVLMELGRADEAFALIDRSEAAPQSVAYRSIMNARAELLLAAGRPQEAVAAAEATGAAAGPIILPAYLPWRSQKARGLVLLGRREEALAIAEEELANARLWGVPGVVGSALRVCGECLDGDAAIERLREATVLLEDSSFRLERVHAHAALGLALGGDAGSDALRRALREAEACGAIRVAAAVRGHLRDRGAAVPAATGAALTETERRVAGAAARGEQQRTIAQALFLAPWQVEEHLRMARRKLGVSDDAELAAALAASTQ